MGRSILLAEDSPTQAERLRLLLEEEGYRVEVVKNGREGLTSVAVRRPDLIISDVLMPEMDGHAFCEALKVSNETRRIPFIFFTEHQAPTDIVEGLLRGADNFIPKSAPDAYLLERVRRIFDQLDHRVRGGLDVEFVCRVGDRDIVLSADKQQIFELLISTLEDTSRMNDRLRESERLLSEQAERLAAVNRELEAFSYSVSHDLRAPLRHVSGFVEMLRQEAGPSLGETGRGHLERIAAATQRMDRLIEDLLAFSRLGRAELRGSRVDLRKLADEVVADLRQQEPGRAVDLGVGDLPEVAADLAMLRVVLTNLVANALKYTRRRERAQIEIGSLPDRQGLAVVFVRDNGAGFDMRYADRLFGVFQRLHSEREFEGTGVGLATVQRIVHRHGGRTWAEGAVDQGATFYFSLPHWHASVGAAAVRSDAG